MAFDDDLFPTPGDQSFYRLRGQMIQRRAQAMVNTSPTAFYDVARRELLELEMQSLAEDKPQRRAVAVMDRPVAMPFVLPPVMPPDDYLDLAERVRLDSPEIMEARISRFFARNGWPVYPYDKVMAYLDQLAKRETRRSHGQYRSVAYWAPLRERDVDGRLSMPRSEWDLGFERDAPAPVYKHRVPGHALQKVATLEEKVPGPLKFAVSDYAAVKPDPFLMVLAGNGRFVIDVWDEPGW